MTDEILVSIKEQMKHTDERFDVYANYWATFRKLKELAKGKKMSEIAEMMIMLEGIKMSWGMILTTMAQNGMLRPKSDSGNLHDIIMHPGMWRLQLVATNPKWKAEVKYAEQRLQLSHPLAMRSIELLGPFMNQLSTIGTAVDLSDPASKQKFDFRVVHEYMAPYVKGYRR